MLSFLLFLLLLKLHELFVLGLVDHDHVGRGLGLGALGDFGGGVVA